MLQRHEPTHETYSTQSHPRIIDYPALVDTIQLSVARLLNIERSEDATSFTEILEDKSCEEQERLICEVGQKFDDELIHFITSCFIGMRNRQIVILADTNEGVNGVLLWEEKLQQHLARLERSQELSHTQLDIIRYSPEDIAVLAQNIKAEAT